MDSFFSFLFNFIYSCTNQKLLEVYLIILTVRLTFLQNQHLIQSNTKCYRLFFNERAINSYFRSIGLNIIYSQHISICLSNIYDISQLEALIIHARKKYCSLSQSPPFYSSTDYVMGILSPHHFAERSHCPLKPRCLGKCPCGYSEGGMNTPIFTSSRIERKLSGGMGQVSMLPPIRRCSLQPLSPQESLVFRSSFDNPLRTRHPSFERAKLEVEDIEDLLCNSESKKIV